MNLVNLISIVFAWEFPGETGSGFFVMINWFIRVFREDRLEPTAES